MIENLKANPDDHQKLHTLLQQYVEEQEERGKNTVESQEKEDQQNPSQNEKEDLIAKFRKILEQQSKANNKSMKEILKQGIMMERIKKDTLWRKEDSREWELNNTLLSMNESAEVEPWTVNSEPENNHWGGRTDGESPTQQREKQQRKRGACKAQTISGSNG